MDRECGRQVSPPQAAGLRVFTTRRASRSALTASGKGVAAMNQISLTDRAAHIGVDADSGLVHASSDLRLKSTACSALP